MSTEVTGVDGCAGGWVAVTLGWAVPDGTTDGTTAVPGGAVLPAAVRVAVAPTLDRLPLAGITGIDIPLGLIAAGWRDADLFARRALGGRGMTVFAIPPRPVFACADYAEANRTCRDLTGKGLSVQAWGLRRKIIEADEFRRRAAVTLHEVHPELAFTVLAGGTPLPDSKHTRAGLTARRELLASRGVILPQRVAGAAADDLLDAAAVAWSARRIADGLAVVLTSPGQLADDGTQIAIRY